MSLKKYNKTYMRKEIFEIIKNKSLYLAAKISTEEISELSELSSQANYMKKLLSIVRERTQDSVIDITMKLTLSALWNLTDESPKTCQVRIQTKK